MEVLIPCIRSAQDSSRPSSSFSPLAAAVPAEEDLFHGRYSREQLEIGQDKFRAIRNAGFISLGTGAALVVTGGVLIGTSDLEPRKDEYGDPIHDGLPPQAIAGIITMAGGFAATSLGIVLTIVGERNRSKYAGMLEAISVRPEAGPGRRGLVIAFRF